MLPYNNEAKVWWTLASERVNTSILVALHKSASLMSYKYLSFVYILWELKYFPESHPLVMKNKYFMPIENHQLSSPIFRLILNVNYCWHEITINLDRFCIILKKGKIYFGIIKSRHWPCVPDKTKPILISTTLHTCWTWNYIWSSCIPTIQLGTIINHISTGWIDQHLFNSVVKNLSSFCVILLLVKL